MHFFYGNETLSNFDWIMRAVVTFFIMVMTAKFMGQRSLSQLRLLDFVVALMLGNIIAHPLSDPTIGMDGSIITTLVIAVLYISGILLSLKWEWLRKFTDPDPMLLIKDGEINYKALRKARITLDYLLSELRKEKIEDVKKVALALWESDGKMSIFLDPQFDPITPSIYHLKTKPFDLPMILIKEGKIHTQRLQQINKEDQWLMDKLKTVHQTEVSNVLLATIDREDNLEVFFYR
jgi:uncharacterized membrane protein YcaP (DUF421 family)